MARPEPQLSLDPGTACFLVLKAREFHAKVEEVDPDEGSNPSDDKAIDVLEFQADDTVQEEIFAAVGALDEDERRDLIALIWLGRGDFGLDEWDAARDGAGDIDPEHVADYILGLPMVSDYLEAGLAQFGHSLGEYLNTAFAAQIEAAAG